MPSAFRSLAPQPSSADRWHDEDARAEDAEEQASSDLVAASVTRQFSLWPFGTRLLRLYLLTDPSELDRSLMRGLLRAMQQEYFRSEGRSQTNALRSTILAAHYVLRHRNRESLPQDWIAAAAACSVTRGATAYVALAGDAAAFTWDGTSVQAHRNSGRVARPLGADGFPRVTFWSAPLAPEHRLLLVCGAAWQDDTLQAVGAVLRDSPPELVNQHLSRVLSGPHGPARVLLADGSPVVPSHARRARRSPDQRPLVARPARPAGPVREAHHPAPPPTGERFRIASGPLPRARAVPPAREADAHAPAPRPRHLRQPLLLAGFLVAVVLAGLMAVGPLGEPQHVALARQAESLLEKAQQTRDAHEAHVFAADAFTFAQKAATAEPASHAALLRQTDLVLRGIDRVFAVEPTTLVQAAPGSSLVDLVVDDQDLFALDASAGLVLRFDASRPGQALESGAPIFQQGRAIGGAPLDAPVAISYVPGADAEPGALAVVDRGRAVLEYSRSTGLVRRSIATAREWQRIAVLASRQDTLFVLDADAGKLLAYGAASRHLNRAPRQVLDALSAPQVPFSTTVDVLPAQDLYVRETSGRVLRFDWQGHSLPFDVRPPDAALGAVSGMAEDGTGGVYLADPANRRIVHVAGDGRFIRQLRASSAQKLATVRSIQAAADGTRLYGLSSNGIVSFALPAEVPTPMEVSVDAGPLSDPAEPVGTRVVK